MNLYEVIRWGNESDNIYTGGPNGPDTCFLVRAATLEHAGQLVDEILAGMPSNYVKGWCSAIYPWGKTLAPETFLKCCAGRMSSTLMSTDGASGIGMIPGSPGSN